LKNVASILLLVVTLLFCTAQSCKQDAQQVEIASKRNVVVILIDGPRYSETFGDSTHQYMPELWTIAQQNTWCSNMYNGATTNTLNGISYITTGQHGNIANGGTQSPEFENMFQRLIERTGSQNKACVISSKDKVQALCNCACAKEGKYLALNNCGVAGLNTGYRNDSTTHQVALQYLEKYKPQLTLITFKEPDASGHAADWASYLNGIRSTSKYTESLVNFLNTNTYYKGNTDIIITNDHGRHLNGVADSFVSHGDTCLGCRHISCTMLGPDFKQNFVDANNYDQRDINATICKILNVGILGVGKPMGALK
jgi:membrane-anchored protein YejM (alkaline phosphatase superfamily)